MMEYLKELSYMNTASRTYSTV